MVVVAELVLLGRFHKYTLLSLFPDASIDMFDFDQPSIPTTTNHTERYKTQHHNNINNINNKNNDGINTVIILATMPTDERHLISLRTELECFVGSASHVVLSSAYWKDPIINLLIHQARRNIPQFASSEVQIEARFFDNERYDAGLWCDGIQGLQSHFTNFILLNDSIFALRQFNGIIDDLQSHNRDMNSLNFNVNQHKQYWFESVFRGFNAHGLRVFQNHSCVSQRHKSFCPRVGLPNRKK